MIGNVGCVGEDKDEYIEPVIDPLIHYHNWRPAAPPLGKRLGDRRKLAWWNPYYDVNVKDIWPQRQTSIQARNLTTTVLVLNALFDEEYGNVDEDLWGGITYILSDSTMDQALNDSFQIWIKGTRGRLHIDVGSIGEDINGDGRINTEDRPVPGFMTGNGLLEPEEDVGLDGCPDEFEDGMGGCLMGDFNGDGTISGDEASRADGDGDGILDEDSPAVADSILAGYIDRIYDGLRVPWADLDDPNGDNFSDTRAINPDLGRNDKINGTEGNSVIREGSYPDTENLDRLGGPFPDIQNDYFTYALQLDPNHPEFDPTILGEETTRNDGTLTGWRLFRIPLADFARVGDQLAYWPYGRYLRIWIDGLDNNLSIDGLNARIQIAKVEFVGNE
jgi:hypothetical protein